MTNNVFKILFFMCISIFMTNAAEARMCYLPFADQCEQMPDYTHLELPADAYKPVKTFASAKLSAPTRQANVCRGYDLDKPLDKNYACSSCTDDSGTHYRCNLVCSAEKCGEGEIYNTQTCMCDEINDTCKKFLHKFKSVAYAPLSSSECSDAKDDLGLQRCVSQGNDYYAGAVMACGGQDHVITAAEAEELAYCMYNPTDTYSNVYGNRYDGFLKSYDADTSEQIFVWVAWEGGNADDKGAIVRMYDVYGSVPYYAERNGSNIEDGSAVDWEHSSALSRTLCRI